MFLTTPWPFSNSTHYFHLLGSQSKASNVDVESEMIRQQQQQQRSSSIGESCQRLLGNNLEIENQFFWSGKKVKRSEFWLTSVKL